MLPQPVGLRDGVFESRMLAPLSSIGFTWAASVLACLCTVLLLWVVVLVRMGRHGAARRQELERVQEQLSDEVWDLRAAAEARTRAEAASEAKSRFLATVSHEIRTPLNGIIGLADLLSGTALSREQQAYVTMMKTSGAALATLVDEVLDLSRIESGRLDLACEPLDLATLVEGVVELVAPRAQDKGLEIACFVASDLPAQVIGDPLRLRQVLSNLADNAVKFTAMGGVGVRVTAAPDGTIAFSVVDTGAGVPPERRAAIFEEFEQADRSTARRHGGTGLGLAIAKRIIARMGGDLAVEDREGGGSIFSFAVPLPGAPGEGESAPRQEKHAERRALLVSAGSFQPAYLQEQLEAEGISVTRAVSLAEARRHLTVSKTQPFGLLLADCSLGEGATRALAGMAREANVSQTLLLFSPTERRSFGQQLAVSFDGWLVKPVRVHSLRARLQVPGRRENALFAPMAIGARRHASNALRVLVAEDNPINALIARTALERCGAQVTMADDGVSALEKAEAALRGGSGFDLVLLDVSMPGLDGLEVTRRIRQVERSLGRNKGPIIAMTADAFESTALACRKAGMDDVLTKPLAPGALRTLIEQRIEMRIAS